MDSAAARALLDEQLRRNLRDSVTTVIDRTDHTVRELSREEPGWAGIAWSDLDDSTADQVIEDELRHFAELGRDFEWKTYDGDRPHDLTDRLLAKGFSAGEPEALMVAAVTDLDFQELPPEGVHIVPVHDAAGVATMVWVAEQAFGSDQAKLGTSVLHQMQVDPASILVVVAMAGDEPVSAARADFHRGTDFVSLWGGGTVPEWRGRGIYRSLVTRRAWTAIERGYSYLRIDATPLSEPILTRMGFVRVGTTTPYQSPAR